MAAAKKTLRFYQNSRIATEVKDALTHSVFRHAGGLLAQRASSADEGYVLMGVSNTDTLMTQLEAAAKKEYSYSPYGHRPARNESNIPLAFNGEPLDLATGCYALGNGYRLYSPTLKRFCSPDNLSPFGKGGLSAYMYCAGDPVNRVDPTGHLSSGVIWSGLQLTGLAVAAAGAGMLITGGVTEDDKLIWSGGAVFALGLTVISAGVVSKMPLHHSSGPTQPPYRTLNSMPRSTNDQRVPAFAPPRVFTDSMPARQPANAQAPRQPTRNLPLPTYEQAIQAHLSTNPVFEAPPPTYQEVVQAAHSTSSMRDTVRTSGQRE
ncbi:RHS repeat-associated core domain-containing protein [Pseudomonas putida]|uniref:RHS repeat-associated core domain-containing protein n=1 Tax=Pseudomonas putida TaxID=303 RepID=UPI0023E3A49C|nr:RHS repeat-associated core domain-containing protein [Pseudomonas putida]MDF3926302.1 RHS repeat-associated core domain-containing protein [Pseudomonas putida]